MNKTIPKVSVIVPIYNVEKYLQQSIDSICKQTYKHLEIILINDGSSDRSKIICDKNSLMDDRILVIHKENGGLSSARNVGLDIASGKYIAFIDADDTIHPRFIEILVGLCEQFECDIAQCDFLTVANESLKLPLNPQRSLVFYSGKQAVSEMCVGRDDVKFSVTWNKIYRRTLFNGIRYPLGMIHEDEFVTYKIIWKAKKMVITNRYLYYYLQRSGSIMGSKYSIKRLDALVAFRERLDFLKKNNLEKEYMALLCKYINLIERSRILLKRNVKNCENIYNELSKEKEKLVEQLPLIPIRKEEQFCVKWGIDNCPYPRDANLVLYGAGKWGNVYYHWIQENHFGNIVGWVDNSWNAIEQTEYIISPIDLLLRVSYDYVLITIKSKSIQEEVTQNLKCWGIPEKKILAI